MKVLVVFAHSEPNSFGRRLLDTSVEALRESGHDVVESDLYAMNFNPVASAATRGGFLDQYAARMQALEQTEPFSFYSMSDFGPDWRLPPEIEPRTVGHHKRNPIRCVWMNKVISGSARGHE